MKKKTSFFVLIGLFAFALLFIPQESPAETDNPDAVEVEVEPKKEPSVEVKEQYRNLQLKITELKEKTKLPPRLRDAQEKIEKISLKLKEVQPEGEPETAENQPKIELTPESRALIDRKRELQTELHIANLPLTPLLEKLTGLAEERKKLEDEYYLAQVEVPMFGKTTSELNSPLVVIEGEVEMRRPDDINISLALARDIAATAFCQIYLNDSFVTWHRWKIGSKEEFKAQISANHRAASEDGLNNLKIILNTNYQDDDVLMDAPPFEESPLVISNESRISARNMLSGSFEIKEVEPKQLEPGLNKENQGE